MEIVSFLIPNVLLLKILLTILTVIFSIICFNYIKRRQQNLPPGPWGIPLLGYIPFLGKYPERTLVKLQKKYGNIFSIYMGNNLTVVLNDYESIQKALHKCNDFNDRPETVSTKILPDDKGILSVNGNFWSMHRRIIIRALRDVGMETLSYEPNIQQEILRFLNFLSTFDGNGEELHETLHMSVSNIILLSLCGVKTDYKDEKFKRLMQLIYAYPQRLPASTLRLVLPWTKYIPFFESRESQSILLDMKKSSYNFFEPIVKQHENNHIADNRSNYINAFLTERKNSANSENFDKSALFDNLLEMLTAGSNTTEPTIRVGILLLIVHPHIQKKFQTEIDEIVGMERLPSLADRQRMPYTMAIIQELLRYSTLAPLGLHHTNPEPTTLLGYNIPAKTTLMTNLWAANYDPVFWKDPEVFRPERFINNAGEFEKSPYVIPFSLGKRICLGENLAKLEIFLYLTSIFQKFNVSLPENEDNSLDVIQNHGLINVAKMYNVRLHKRENYFVH